MTQIQLPEKVNYIISQLEQAGFEAYAVGGCVRDCLLGRQPSDWDVTTSAKPLQVKDVFRHTIDTGIQHGTVTVMLDHEGFEVTTYRLDGEYEDSRHPREVIFTANLIEDLKRRDFTINAFAYTTRAELSMPLTGLKICLRACFGASAMPPSGLARTHCAFCVQSAFRHSWDFRLRRRPRPP